MKKAILFVFIFSLSFPIIAKNHHYKVIVGTYTTPGKSEGIYVYNIDPKQDYITPDFIAKDVQNPSFIALSADKSRLYSVNQNDKLSTISAFAFNQNSGELSLLNKVDAKGDGPCFVSATQYHVVTANYNSGNVSVFGINTDGTLTEALQVIRHVGKSVNPYRQEAPHVHQTIFSPDGKYLAVNDLGTDKVFIYKYNKNGSANTLTPFDSLKMKAGSGPRHIAFSKNGKRIYLIQELDGTLSVLEMKNGKLKLLQENSVVKRSGIETSAADIHLSPDGKFVYATNRGTANEISCFAIEKDGTLTYRSQVSTGGSGPRNFAISPDGKFVFVAHQYTDDIVIFSRDLKTGMLINSGKSISISSPVCILFY